MQVLHLLAINVGDIRIGAEPLVAILHILPFQMCVVVVDLAISHGLAGGPEHGLEYVHRRVHYAARYLRLVSLEQAAVGGVEGQREEVALVRLDGYRGQGFPVGGQIGGERDVDLDWRVGFWASSEPEPEPSKKINEEVGHNSMTLLVDGEKPVWGFWFTMQWTAYRCNMTLIRCLFNT